MGCKVKSWRFPVAMLAVGTLVLGTMAYGERGDRGTSKDKSAGVQARVDATPTPAPVAPAGRPKRLESVQRLPDSVGVIKQVGTANGAGSAAAGVDGATATAYSTLYSGYVSGAWNVDDSATCGVGMTGWGDELALFGLKGDGTDELEGYTIQWAVLCELFDSFGVYDCNGAPGDNCAGYCYPSQQTGPGPAGEYHVTSVLWDGQPTPASASCTSPGNMIPGTMCTFESSCSNARCQARCQTGKTLLPTDDIWISVFVEDIDDFWFVIGGTPIVGSSLGNADFYVDSTGDGCFDSFDCFDLSPVFSCDGCDWYHTPSVDVNAQVAMKVTPILPPADSKWAGSYSIRTKSANKADEIVLAKGGLPVWFDIMVTDFDPKQTGIGTTGCQTRIDPAGYTSGLQGTLTPYEVACADDAICVSQLGSPAKCGPTPEFARAGVCEYAQIKQSRPDSIGGNFAALDVSSGAIGYLNSSNADQQKFLGSCVNDPSVLCDTRNGQIDCIIAGVGGDCVLDKNLQYYIGRLVLWVPADAKGQFTIPLIDFPESFCLQFSGDTIPLLGVVPGFVTVETGQCCDLDALGTPDECIGDDLTINECTAAGGETFDPTKTCDDPCACTTNADCDDGVACTDDTCLPDGSCSNVANNANCDNGLACDGLEICDPALDCQAGTPVDCNDHLDCTDDACNEPSGTCSNVKLDCSDADPCTIDSCDEGTPDDGARSCSNVLLPSVPDPACPVTGASLQECLDNTIDQYTGAPVATAWDAASGCCLCVLCCNDTPCDDVSNACPPCTANLAFDIHPSDKPNGNCFAQGEKLTVDVVADDTLQVINGAQFVVNYDPSCVVFNSISPGGDPYTYEIDEIVDRATGRIFYAVGVDPFGGAGGFGGVLATMSFTKLGHPDCTNCIFTFGGEKPMEPTMVNDEGQPICPVPKPSKEIHVNPRLTLNVPDSVTVNADCDVATADVSWDAPTATSSCVRPGCDPAKEKCYDVDLECSGMHENGEDESAMAMTGGTHHQGVTHYQCTATGNICGGTITKEWTVTVTDQQSLDVELQLSPIMAGPVTRCINFELWSDCVQPPVAFQQEVEFGGKGDFIGKFTDKKKIPKGQYVCITARDQQHSLRACDFVDCVGGQWFASLTGDPFFGGKWLIQGNLDGWKKDNPNASVDHIDILDFGQFVANFGATVDPNTDCASKHDGPHADINGDGVVDSLDFSFIALNFLSDSNDCCCPESQPAASVARTEVSVVELRQMGLDHMTVADLNGDGLVNMDDMSAFMAGQTPSKKTPTRDRSGLGGSR